MKLIINGQSQEYVCQDLTALLQILNKPANGLAIAVNEQIVPHQQWPQFQLTENDNISIFQAIAGG